MTVTRFLIAANILVFVLQQLLGQVLIVKFALWPLGDFFARDVEGPIGFRPWQLVTSAFLHGGVAHLALNMFALYMFGREIERTLGSKRFTVLYSASVLTASVTQLLVVTATGEVYPTLGASGGVFGVLLAFGILFPDRIVVLLFPPIPMRARYFVALYGLVELAQGVLGTQAGVAHFAHLGGMLGAGIVLYAWRRRR
jgi:membrane associated rhomboid family serine protease